MELWKSVIGHPEYEVSNLGTVRSVDRYVNCNSGQRLVCGVPLKPKITKGGYLSVALCKERRVKHRLVHNLVLEAFVGPKPEGMQGCHSDNNPKNNTLDNLSYKTVGDNHIDKVKAGRTARGAKVNTAKLTEAEVVSLREERALGVPIEKLASKYGISTPAVSYICIGKNWKYAGGPRTEPQSRVMK